MADQIDTSVIPDAPATPPDNVPGQIDAAVAPADAAPGADLPQPEATPAAAVEPLQDAKPVDDGVAVVDAPAPVADAEGPAPVAEATDAPVEAPAEEAAPLSADAPVAEASPSTEPSAPTDGPAPAEEAPAEAAPLESTDTSGVATEEAPASEDAPKEEEAPAAEAPAEEQAEDAPAEDAPVTDTAVAVPDVGETPTEDKPADAPAAPEAPAADPVTGAPVEDAPSEDEAPKEEEGSSDEGGELPTEEAPHDAPSAPDAPAADPVTGKPMEEGEAAPIPGAAETEAAPAPSDDGAPKNWDGSDGIAGEGPTHSGSDTPPVLTTNPADPVDGKPLAPQGDGAAPAMGVDPAASEGPKVPPGYNFTETMGGISDDSGLGTMRFASGVQSSEAPSENSDSEEEDFELTDEEMELIEKLRDLKELFHAKGSSSKHLIRRGIKWLEKMLKSFG